MSHSNRHHCCCLGLYALLSGMFGVQSCKLLNVFHSLKILICNKKRGVGRFFLFFFFPLIFPSIGLRVFSVEKGCVGLALRICLYHLMRGIVYIERC